MSQFAQDKLVYAYVHSIIIMLSVTNCNIFQSQKCLTFGQLIFTASCLTMRLFRSPSWDEGRALAWPLLCSLWLGPRQYQNSSQIGPKL